MTFYLFEYNNYYNRIVKKLPDIQSYEDEGTLLYSLENTNFIPNDGISTEHIVNYDAESGNYAIVTDGPNDEIISRWFVLDAVRVRQGQYKLSLYRDVIADWYDDVVNAPMFVEKALLDTGNDLIFNNENMTYNQVKTSETLLKDDSGTAWWTAYVSSDVGQIELTVPSTEITPDIEVSSIEQYDYYQYQEQDYDGDYTGPVLYTVDVRKASFGRQATLRFSIDARNNSPTTPLNLGTVYPYLDNNNLPTGVGSLGKTNNLGNDYELVYQSPGNDITNATLLINGWQELIESQNENSALVNSAYTYIGNKKGNDILDEQDKIIYDVTAGKYYKVSVYVVGSRRYERRIPVGSGLDLQLRSAVSNSTLPLINPVGSPFLIDATFKAYRILLTEVVIDQYTLTIPATRRHCEDAPYDILMFPYSNEDIYQTGVGSTVANSINTQRIIKQLMLNLAANQQLYDVQLLPYCPISESIMSQYPVETMGGIINVDNLEAGKDYVLNDNMFAYFPTSCNFTKVLNNVGEPQPQLKITIEVPDDPIDFKVANECDKYRLCSPNFNGAFEFSATKNRGVVGYSVTCSYKPYTPYIKVAPIFQGLYGSDFNDARGLVCGGDFSVSQISDAFTTYELNNKNYQIMFDRQIQNMEVNNSVQREMERWNVATGVLNAGVSGAMTGGMIGGGLGAAIGGGIGAVGAGLSLAGGIRDIQLNEQLRTEALDYTKDQFGYQLGNIQALPYNLTKVTARNADNKLFPFVEYYTATEREKEALRSKIKFNGMTVMVIDQINNYIKAEPSYIKGRLIRLEIDEDFHVVNTIANELNKGVFI